MSLMASYVDGQFQTSTSAESISSSSDSSSSSAVSSEAFLQLLVAEMQNQDPLEPTSNTEWISQYATFTQVSEIQEIADTMDNLKAQNLVGEYVIMKVTSSTTGNTEYVSGKVDYVTYENDEAYLSINGEYYSIKDLDTVADQDYLDATNLASDISSALENLPDLNLVTTGDQSAILSLYNKVANMTDYQLEFVDSDTISSVEAYYNRLVSLMTAESASQGSSEAEDTAETAESTDAAEVSENKEDI